MKLEVFGPAGKTTVYVDDDISEEDLKEIVWRAANEEHGNGLMMPRRVS